MRINLGRVIGALIVVQLIGLIVPFIMVTPFATSDYMTNAATAASRVRIGAFLLLANAALTMAISIALYPAARARAPRAALWTVALSAIWLALQGVDSAHLLSMLSHAERQTASAPAGFELLAQSAYTTRVWMHYTTLLAIEGWFFAFYLMLQRARAIPGGMGIFALAMPLVHAAGITLPKFLDFERTMTLAMSLALSHVVVGGWLLLKGFEDPRRQID